MLSPVLLGLAVYALLRVWTRKRPSAVPMRSSALRRLQRRRVLPPLIEISRSGCGGAGELHPANKVEVLCERAL